MGEQNVHDSRVEIVFVQCGGKRGPGWARKILEVREVPVDLSDSISHNVPVVSPHKSSSPAPEGKAIPLK